MDKIEKKQLKEAKKLAKKEAKQAKKNGAVVVAKEEVKVVPEKKETSKIKIW